MADHLRRNADGHLARNSGGELLNGDCCCDDGCTCDITLLDPYIDPDSPTIGQLLTYSSLFDSGCSWPPVSQSITDIISGHPAPWSVSDSPGHNIRIRDVVPDPDTNECPMTIFSLDFPGGYDEGQPAFPDVSTNELDICIYLDLTTCEWIIRYFQEYGWDGTTFGDLVDTLLWEGRKPYDAGVPVGRYFSTGEGCYTDPFVDVST